MEQTSEEERLELNSLGPNNIRAVLSFAIDKSREKPGEDICSVCEIAYQARFCILCQDIRTNNDPLEVHNNITYGKIREVV